MSYELAVAALKIWVSVKHLSEFSLFVGISQIYKAAVWDVWPICSNTGKKKAREETSRWAPVK